MPHTIAILTTETPRSTMAVMPTSWIRRGSRASNALPNQSCDGIISCIYQRSLLWIQHVAPAPGFHYTENALSTIRITAIQNPEAIALPIGVAKKEAIPTEVER